MDRDESLLPSGPQCQVLGRSLVSFFVKRGDVVDVVLLSFSPCGYCLEASMTNPARHSRVGGNPQGGVMRLSCFTLAFDSSPIKGEGVWLVGLDLMSARPSPLDCGSSPQ